MSEKESASSKNTGKAEQTIDVTIFSLTDPDLLKNIMAYTKEKFSLSDNKMAQINDQDEILAEIKIRPGQDPSTKSHPYVFLHDVEADLRYEDIGRVLRHYKPEVVKKIVGLVLKVFRGRPINNALAEIEKMVKQNDFLLVEKIDSKMLSEELENNYFSPYKKKNEQPKPESLEKFQTKKKKFVSAYEKLIPSPKIMVVQLIGLMAAEGGRGKTGLMNFVAHLEMIKSWDSDPDVRRKPLDTALSEELFPIDYDLTKGEHRIAVGYMGSENDIKKATELVDKCLWKQNHENPALIFQKEQAVLLASFKTANREKQRLESHLKLTSRDIQQISGKNPRAFWKASFIGSTNSQGNNLERKFIRHAKVLYGESPKLTLVEEIKIFIDKQSYDECHQMLKEKIQKAYLGEHNINDINGDGNTLLHIFSRTLITCLDKEKQKIIEGIIYDLLKLNPNFHIKNKDEEILKDLLIEARIQISPSVKPMI